MGRGWDRPSRQRSLSRRKQLTVAMLDLPAYQLGEAEKTSGVSQDGGAQNRGVALGHHIRQAVNLAGSRADATIAAFLKGAAVTAMRTHWLAVRRTRWRWGMTKWLLAVGCAVKAYETTQKRLFAGSPTPDPRVREADSPYPPDGVWDNPRHVQRHRRSQASGAERIGVG